MKTFKLYKVWSPDSEYYYLGITGCTLRQRFSSHLNRSKTHRTKFYSWLSKHRSDAIIEVVAEFLTKEECYLAEIFCIALGKNLDQPILNLAAGGESGYVVPESGREEWLRKLRKARVGRTPAKGMSHSDETKRRCKDASVDYWSGKDTFTDMVDVSLSYKDAKRKWGISKTHFYRLRRRSLADD